MKSSRYWELVYTLRHCCGYISEIQFPCLNKRLLTNVIGRAFSYFFIWMSVSAMWLLWPELVILLLFGLRISYLSCFLLRQHYLLLLCLFYCGLCCADSLVRPNPSRRNTDAGAGCISYLVKRIRRRWPSIKNKVCCHCWRGERSATVIAVVGGREKTGDSNCCHWRKEEPDDCCHCRKGKIRRLLSSSEGRNLAMVIVVVENWIAGGFYFWTLATVITYLGFTF